VCKRTTDANSLVTHVFEGISVDRSEEATAMLSRTLGTHGANQDEDCFVLPYCRNAQDRGAAHEQYDIGSVVYVERKERLIVTMLTSVKLRNTIGR
jgi:hypothetical protein